MRSRLHSLLRSLFTKGCLPLGLLSLAASRAHSTSEDVVLTEHKISDSVGGLGPALADNDFFGSAICSLGDLNGDGFEDLAVGAFQSWDVGSPPGSVWILFLGEDTIVEGKPVVTGKHVIDENSGDLHAVTLDARAHFGTSLCYLGDLDGDGAPELAVGATWQDGGAAENGSVILLSMNSDGTTKSALEIINPETGVDGKTDNFGRAVACIGDVDGNGYSDIAVGADKDDDGGPDQDYGAVWVLFMDGNGGLTVSNTQKISATQGGFMGGLSPSSGFGASLAGLGDLDGSGPSSLALAVGGRGDDDAGSNAGAVWILFLNSAGAVLSHTKITEGAAGFGGDLQPEDFFGNSLAAMDEIGSDGTRKLAVGAYLTDAAGGTNQGATWMLTIEADGTVCCESKINPDVGGFDGNLDDNDLFGTSVCAFNDFNGDGSEDLVVAAYGDDDAFSGIGTQRGALWFLAMGTLAAEVSRLGTPTNPDVFLPGVTSGPVTGATWDPVVDHTTFKPNAVVDFLIFSTSELNVDLGFNGTLLCGLPFINVSPPIVSVPGVPFRVPIPDDCVFVGASLFVQAGSEDGGGFMLTNALDITIGSIGS